MTKKFNVFGMTCSACSFGVERAVNNLDGVKSVCVSLLSKEMIVEYDSEILSAEKIILAVENIGYSASEYGVKIFNKYEDAMKLKARFLMSLILLVPLIYLCMGGLLGLPQPKIIVNYIFQFAFTTLVLLINRVFFINGINAIKLCKCKQI